MFQWWRTECRADCFMEANYCNWFWHFKAATLYTFMTGKQCRGMYCQGGGFGRGAGRCLKKLMNRNIWWGGHRWPERMSAMSRPYGVPPTPTPSLTNLRLSSCPHSGSFYNMTLRDDGSRGGCTESQTCWNDSPSIQPCTMCVICLFPPSFSQAVALNISLKISL